jgi:hypothetical protein
MTSTGFLTFKARASTVQDIEFATDSYYESYGADVDIEKYKTVSDMHFNILE